MAPSIPILVYGRRAAEWHARERARLTVLGKAPAFADSQIAAVAKVHGLTVVTENVPDFERFEGLTVESWRTA